MKKASPLNASSRTMGLAIGESTVALELPSSAREIRDWEQVCQTSGDIRQKLSEALQSPLDFVPLSQAIVEGDTVAIAVEPGVPQAVEVVQELVAYLLEHGCDATQLTVVLAHDHESLIRPLSDRLLAHTGHEIDIRFHRGDDVETMGYLAAAQGAEAIYIDRALLEADVVLPVTCARDPQAWAYAGLFGIVPWFTDSGTQSRWRHDAAADGSTTSQQRCRAAKEVAWLLGIQGVVAVLPGGCGMVDSLYFGQVDAVAQAIAESVRDRSLEIEEQPVSLVVVSIDGDHDQQTWENVARALHLAENFLRPDGVVAVVSELDQMPGPVFRWLSSLEDAETVHQHLKKSHHPQALAAIEIHRAKTKRAVYLMSQLDSDRVEELGLTSIRAIEELEHLIAAHPSCLVINGAQHRWLVEPSTRESVTLS